MKNVLFVGILVLMVCSLALGQAGPFSGNAQVNLIFDPANPTLGGGNLNVQVWVDLTGITGAGSITAALGGFAIPVAFDNSRVKFESAVAGAGVFSSGFVFTDKDRANARGFVTVIGTQTATNGTPAGLIHAATLTFSLIEAGKALFDVNSARTVHEGSLASAYFPPNGGPDAVLYTDHLITLTIAPSATNYKMLYPVFVSTATDFQGVTVVNETASSASLTFRAYNTGGQLIQQSGMSNPSGVIALDSMKQFVRMVQNPFTGSDSSLNLDQGWVEVESPSHNLSGFFLLGHIVGSDITEMDGADISHTSSAAGVLLPVLWKDATRETELFVINPGTQAATGNLLVVNSNGTTAQTIPVSIPAHGIYEDSFPANTLTGDGYFWMQLTAGKAIGFEKFGNSQALACLNGQDATLLSNLLYAAHFASGNFGIRYFTELNVINPGNVTANVTFHLLNDQGVEVVTPVVRAIAAKSQLRIQGHTLFGLPDPTTATGGVTGAVMVQSDSGIVGNVTFGDVQTGKFLSSLPLLSTASAKRELYLDHVAVGVIGSTHYFTGTALVNPSQTRTATATLTLYDQDGVQKAQQTITLAPGNRRIDMLPGLMGLAGDYSQMAGFLKITSDVELLCFQLFGDAANFNFLSAVPVR